MSDQAKGTMTDADLFEFGLRHGLFAQGGLDAEEGVKFCRALLAEAGERVIAALVEEVPCNRNERDGLIRRILGVKHGD